MAIGRQKIGDSPERLSFIIIDFAAGYQEANSFLGYGYFNTAYQLRWSAATQ